MKIPRLVSALVLAAFAAATPFSRDDGVAAGGDVPARSQFLAGRESDAECSSCIDFIMARCDQARCRNAGTPECALFCRNLLCRQGPARCHETDCAIPWRCGSEVADPLAPGPPRRTPWSSPDNPEGLPPHEPGTTNTITEPAERDPLAPGPPPRTPWSSPDNPEGLPPDTIPEDASASDDAPELKKRADVESDPSSGEPDCTECGAWMKTCKRTQCTRPWGPECQWDCQNRLCKSGPARCRRGGECGKHARCGGKGEMQPPTV